MVDGEDHHGRHQRRRHGVVDNHQPDPSLAVEQGTHDRTQGEPRQDGEQHGQARQTGRPISLQHKKHQDDLPHLPAQPRQQCPERDAGEAGHPEKGGI